jgi:hypothetical protein
MQRLAKVVPDCFDDAMELSDFATKRSKPDSIGVNDTVIDMLKNARTALFKAHVGMKVDFALRKFSETNQIDFEAL